MRSTSESLLRGAVEEPRGATLRTSLNPGRIAARVCELPLWFATVIKLVSARVVRWSGAVCAMLSRRSPISSPRKAKVLANRRALDASSSDAITNLYLRPGHKVDPESVAGIPHW